MKIIFAGTPQFAIPALEALFHSEHKILAVLTQPDRPAGRGQRLTAPPVKTLALKYNLPLLQYESLKNEAVLQEFNALNPDIFIDVACGLFIPESILKLPHNGCINVHPSLLPRWRGAAPIQRAILAGDDETGVTIMQMDKGLDTGDILKQERTPIVSDDTSQTLAEKLALTGAKLLLQVLAEIENDSLHAIKQDESLATYAAKITKDEAKINWQNAATEIARMVRAFNPWPVAFTFVHGKNLRIWQAEAIADVFGNNYPVGSIIKVESNSIYIATGRGALQLKKIQLPGKQALPVSEILKANRELFTVGSQLV